MKLLPLFAPEELEQFLPLLLGDSSEHPQRKGYKAKLNSNKLLGKGNVHQKEREGELAVCHMWPLVINSQLPQPPGTGRRERCDVHF